jgi:signal transduction histidine kinase/ABC-type amino acid transport substrate-binding protein
MKIKGKNNFIRVVLLCLAGGICAQANPINDTKINKTRKITIAAEPDYPPYCIIDKNNHADGFSIDLFQAAAKAANIEVEIKIGLWNKIKQDLADGAIDALPLMGRTPEREKFFDFTLPYLSLHGAIFVRKGTTTIHSVADLKEKEILVMKGDNAEEFARRHHISNNIVTTTTFEEAFRKLAEGEGDAVIVQRVIGIQLLKSMGVSTIVPLDILFNEFRQDFCFAVKKGNKELLASLNEGLSIVIANKTYDEIYLRWFGPAIKRQLTVTDVVEIAIYILIPSIIIFSIIAIFFLRREVHRRTESLQKEISEHKKAVLSLHNQQILLKEMERVSKVGGWEYDVGSKKITWTDGVYDIYGISRSEYGSPSLHQALEFFHAEERKILEDAFQKTLISGESYDLILKLVSGDGISKWIRTSGHAIYGDGTVLRIYGNYADITEQKNLEDEYRRIEQNLRKFQIELETAVAKRTEELNEKIQRLNMSEKAMLYMVEDLNTTTAELKQERHKLEIMNREVEERSSELTQSQSALLNLVDDMNIQSEELKRSTNQLEIANKELEAFAYSVSHDLRAPLRHIDGFIELLRNRIKTNLDEQTKRYLDVISGSAKQMGTLIDDLLSFSRMGRQEMEKKQVDVNGILRDIVQDLHRDAEGRQIEWIIHDLPKVNADLSMLRLVLVNLLSNAQKYTRNQPHAKIEIGCLRDKDDDEVFFVRDNGAGFDMRYVDKLFGVFQRLHRQEEFEGTGIGLANVRRIIQRHGGKTWAEGEINKGAAFYFSLPRKIS